ncbi:MAG: anthranilate phosphoribosyltransferase [Ignavibacteria bacterium]|nr:anthranilate phosphoribosyltransferase [Ignavibacteria bacterium]
MKNEIFAKVIAGEKLSVNEAYDTMSEIMSGNVNHARLAAFLIAIKSRGEDPAEIAGFATAMREKSIRIKSDSELAIDVCGTGGDGASTFNISTAAAFVVAGAGVTVAKHGNRAVSSICGSADVLHELGVDINMDVNKTERALNSIGIAFLFAPNYHPAMKYAAQVRKELGVRTVFNILGPLTNPAGVKRQLTGTFSASVSSKMALAAKELGYDKVCFVTSGANIDEVTLNEKTSVFEYSKETDILHYQIGSDSFRYPIIEHEKLGGTTAEHNARILMDIFQNKSANGAFHVVAANAAMGLYVAGYSNDLLECSDKAEESIKSGKALAKLKALQNFS